MGAEPDPLARIENHTYTWCMIERTLAPVLREAAERMPVVAVTGPRQSGKTTLCRSTFGDHAYVSLEPLDARQFAASDPRGFLAQNPGPVVIDEVQRVPDLFSYLQEAVDHDPAPGRFILTGSHHFGLSQAISQSLAGRIETLHLLPPSLEELEGFEDPPKDLWSTLWMGAYPRIHDQRLPPSKWLGAYTGTYVQRDVREILQVTSLEAFTSFLGLVAGRTGQELNLSSLGNDAGVTHPTVRAWISVLEASFVVFRLPAWLRNPRKRVVRSPKLHFVDSGLACSLLRIRSPEQLRLHPLRGAIFESWVAAEILKARLHRGLPADLFHLRETRGIEVDMVLEGDRHVTAVEVKSAATIATDFFPALREFEDRARALAPHLEPRARLVFGGDEGQRRSDVDVLPWHDVQSVDWG